LGDHALGDLVARAALGRDGVDLVEEDDRRGGLSGPGEHLSNCFLALADVPIE
jgi:hypothetical protein